MTISKHLVIPQGCRRRRGNHNKYFTVSGVNTFNESDLEGDISLAQTCPPAPPHGPPVVVRMPVGAFGGLASPPGSWQPPAQD